METYWIETDTEAEKNVFRVVAWGLVFTESSKGHGSKKH